MDSIQKIRAIVHTTTFSPAATKCTVRPRRQTVGGKHEKLEM
jgi:hypothetical protein